MNHFNIEDFNVDNCLVKMEKWMAIASMGLLCLAMMFLMLLVAGVILNAPHEFAAYALGVIVACGSASFAMFIAIGFVEFMRNRMQT